jgi:hypothetical protein
LNKGFVMGIVKQAAVGWLLSALLVGSAMASVVAEALPFSSGAEGQQSDQNSTSFSQAITAPAGTVLEAIRWWGFVPRNASSAGAHRLRLLLLHPVAGAVDQVAAAQVVQRPGVHGFERAGRPGACPSPAGRR